MHPEFEAVIGLEVHVQLATETKIFCPSQARLKEGTSVSDEKVNIHTCPICAGHPGTLPVLNKKAVEYAVKAGLAIQAQIRKKSVFARKHYFYPDLPKGYQISQYDLPLCENGTLEVETKEGVKTIGVQRIHMEEDAGKNVHMSGFSLVNLNRAGVPLIEIVSQPDMRTPEEAGAYLRALYSVVTYLGICDGNLQEGNFRCDANVSVRPKGQEKFGTRAEIKNVNSFRFVEKAIEYEIARQIEVVQSGGKIIQETRLYDSAKNMTFSMRSKEEAEDYRYFPDPDLPALVIEDSYIEKIRENLPELPQAKKKRFIDDYALSSYDAGVLTASKSLAEFYEQSVGQAVSLGLDSKEAAKGASNLISGEVLRLLNEENIDIQKSKIRPVHLAEILALLKKQTLSSTNAKKVIATAWKTGEKVEVIVQKEGLAQVSDTSALEPIVDEVIRNHPDQVAQYKGGKDKLLGFFVGQVMKASKGQANPGMLQELIKKKLS